MALQVLYQDEFLVAIDKPAGMLVHPGSGGERVEWIVMKCLRDQLGRQVFPVHRLDRPTSGVLLFALDKQTAGFTQQAFEQRKVLKIYHAVVEGVSPQRWVCETPLKSHPEGAPRAAATRFERLGVAVVSGEVVRDFSLLEATPATGRFHQIRRHLLEAGLPIVGDFRYAGQDLSYELGEFLGTGTRMLLQSKVLDLEHPRTQVRLRIEAPEDVDFRKVFPDVYSVL
jgi:tRNA pseudouridine65 synthase